MSANFEIFTLFCEQETNMLPKSGKIHPLLSIVLPARSRFTLILRLPFNVLPIIGSPGLISVISGPGMIRTLASYANRSA